jgi:GT2 family glycosyltransferase/Flp pilus assembly protein TadD
VSLKYLFGPVDSSFADQNLRQVREAGECITFNATGNGVDLTIREGDTWPDICGRFPNSWQPDCVVFWLAYSAIPSSLWSAPVPIIGLAADWNLQWHAYRHILPRCDQVLTDRPGCDFLVQAGFHNVHAACLFGTEADYLSAPAANGQRDLDVLFVGNMHPAVQSDRLSWLGRVARLSGRWNVAIYTGIWGADYRALLARAKIVFNRSIRGEANRRAFESTASGALLLQEEGNRELREYFEPGREYVEYNENDLETKLRHFLEHDDERQTIAAAGQRRARNYSFAELWNSSLARLGEGFDGVRQRVAERACFPRAKELQTRVWQVLSGGSDPSLVADLREEIDKKLSAAAMHNNLGVILLATGSKVGPAVSCFAAGLSHEPAHCLIALNYAEALARQGDKQAALNAAKHARRLLDKCSSIGNADLDTPPLASGFDSFRTAWERAALENVGDPASEAKAKHAVLYWRSQALLAELTGDVHHYHEAVLANPELPLARAALGCALGREGRPVDAVPHLKRAFAGNPFDASAARALAQALKESGDCASYVRLAADRRLLHRAALQLVPPEPWFVSPTTSERHLASIIVLCCNQLAYTRLCLESVLRHTHTPYEMILVDNGSTDETPSYLELIRARPGPERVVVIRNADNKGFPAGCNQGLAAAEGQYIVFLNNDVVVTPNWLEALIKVAEQEGRDVGMVGPVTNYAPDPQRVSAPYGSELGRLEAFAESYSAQFADRILPFARLTGFCLLARRVALDMAGGAFDEGFGLGFFDDDDLCIRVRQAGFRLLVAQGVFVHHFGSRTFSALGINCKALLENNLAKFADKWGAEEASQYRHPGVPTESTLSSPNQSSPLPNTCRPRVSLCMIVKNEEQNLADCLSSAADLVDELVVVDTGSADKTKEIACRFGARVFDFPWVDSFSAARNESLRHATGSWIFWLDADDRIDEENREKLRRFLASLGDENASYVMKCLCLPQGPGSPATAVDHVRIFRNRPDVRWSYQVHEQILPAIRRTRADVRWSEVVIHHTGYQDPSLRRRKLERDLRLLRQEQAEKPDEPFTLFNLGQVTRELGDWVGAIPLLRRSLERSHPSDSIVRKLYALLVECHRKVGQSDLAAQACSEGLRIYPDDAELLFLDGLIHRDRGDFRAAACSWERLLAAKAAAHFASVDAELRGSKGKNNLAVVYRQLGRTADAELLWQQIANEQPDFAPAWLGLGEVALDRGDWDAVEQFASQLQSRCRTKTEASVLRARSRLLKKEFDSARAILEEAITENPNALWPRVVLSHVLLQNGGDDTLAEQALRSVLELDPNHAEARHNLGLLLAERDRRLKSIDSAFSGNLGLSDLYYSACRSSSDINEHLPTLVVLSRDCRHITEFGTRTGASTTAFLYAQPDRLVCYDRVRYPQVDRLAHFAGNTDFQFHRADVLWTEIEDTDLLFIDTLHDYEQLATELKLHARKARRYVVLHDTTTFGDTGETPGHRGLWPAVEEFVREGAFRIKERFTNNNGLTILERIARTDS